MVAVLVGLVVADTVLVGGQQSKIINVGVINQNEILCNVVQSEKWDKYLVNNKYELAKSKYLFFLYRNCHF